MILVLKSRSDNNSAKMIAGNNTTYAGLDNSAIIRPAYINPTLSFEIPININTLEKKKSDSEYGRKKKIFDGINTE